MRLIRNEKRKLSITKLGVWIAGAAQIAISSGTVQSPVALMALKIAEVTGLMLAGLGARDAIGAGK